MGDSSIVVIMAVLLLCSATCSGSETALYSVKRSEILQAGNDRLNTILLRLLDQGDRLLMAILLLNNAINIAFFALASYWSGINDQLHPLTITLGALTSLIVVGEIIPKVIASERPLILSRLVAPLWLGAIFILGPIIYMMEKVLRPIIASSKNSPEFPEIEADELKLVLEQSHRQGVVSSYVHDRLVEVVTLSQIPAFKVMTHRLDCCTIARDTSREDAIAALRLRPSPYLMLLDEDEHCIGLLGAQHLLKDGKPSKRMVKPLIIPGVTSLAQALELMQREKANAGIVVDEYGGTDGLLTLSHLAAVLLGDSADDSLGAVRIEQLDENRWRISGNAPIDPWKALLNSPQITNEVATIGGFLIRISGSIPEVNDRLLFNNILFIVEETEGMRVKTLLVEKLAGHEARRMTQQQVAVN